MKIQHPCPRCGTEWVDTEIIDEEQPKDPRGTAVHWYCECSDCGEAFTLKLFRRSLGANDAPPE
jgi:uncharacterized Zn finger protein